MTAVIIGVDPHKGSHTAVVTGQAETVLGRLRVRAGAVQADRLLAWAAAWPERTWAVEGARGMGYLPDWQLAAAGERVPGRAAQAGRAGAAAGHRGDEQERPQRRPVGRHRRAALGRRHPGQAR
jgi:hypothetical protein